MSRLQHAVLMPAYNAAAVIDRALASIAEQRHPVDQVIVVDDGSGDGTAERAQAWSGRLPLTLMRNERNSGITASLRRGAEAASADWVLRLDADDRWLPEHVGALAQAVAQTHGAVLASASARFVGEDGEELGTHVAPSDGRVRARLMWDNPLIHSASGFLRAAYLQVGGYPMHVRWEDYPLWIRLLARGSLASVPHPTMEYTVSSKSLSRVGRLESLQARWVCQREAIGTFWARHPVVALGSAVAGGGRLAWARLQGKGST